MGLNVIHTKGYMHRDIKPNNIFLQIEGDRVVAKIGDLGHARRLPTKNADPELTKQGLGTNEFMAPELYLEKDYDASVDIYSLGVTFMYLFTGIYPFPKFKNHCKTLKLFEENPDIDIKVVIVMEARLPEFLSEELRAMILRMMTIRPEGRPKIAEVLKCLKEELKEVRP